MSEEISSTLKARLSDGDTHLTGDINLIPSEIRVIITWSIMGVESHAPCTDSFCSLAAVSPAPQAPLGAAAGPAPSAGKFSSIFAASPSHSGLCSNRTSEHSLVVSS